MPSPSGVPSPTGRATGNTLTGPQERGTAEKSQGASSDVVMADNWEAKAIPIWPRGREKGPQGWLFYDDAFRHDTSHAYKAGQAVAPLELVKIDGASVAKLIEKPTRKLLSLWHQQYGKRRRLITSAWRDNQKQFDLYEAWVEGRRNAIVAIPGWSNHQDGLALDLKLGDPKTDIRMFQEGKLKINWYDSDAYRWMVTTAPSLKFIRTVPSEPWHWEYRPERQQPFPVLPV